MSKFGLDDPQDSGADLARLDEKLAAFPPVSPRQRIDVAAVDAAAAEHGFVSREPAAKTPPPTSSVTQWPLSHGGRRRRIAQTEPTRHLAIRLTLSQYDRFVAYADRHQVTYHDALARLLDEAGAN
jgi:hypothetical protein